MFPIGSGRSPGCVVLEVMAHCSVALVGQPAGVWVRPGMPGPLCHCTPSGLAASCGVGTIVANDRLSGRAQTPVTRCSLRLSTRAGRPVGGAPISTTAFWQGPAIPRAASTSTKSEGGRSTARLRRPLCGPPPPGILPSLRSATAPCVTCGPRPPSQSVASTCPRHHSGHETSHAGRCPAASAANSTPTLWSSRAHAGCRTWSSLVLGHARRCDTASACSPLRPLRPDDACTRASRKMPSPTPTPHCSQAL